MAGEILSFGIQKLWDLLSQEYELFQGFEDQVTVLKSDLNWLSSFVEDADAKKHTNPRVKNCLEEIKEIIFDGEDIIQTFIQKQKLRKTSGVKKSIRRLPCIIPDRRENALDIQGISTKISKVIQNMQSFGVKEIIRDSGYMQPLRDRQRAMRQEFARDSKSNFVGLEENLKKLVGYLVEKDNIRIVSVTGMGGLGKTTLARQAFNHEMVKSKFDRFVWVCVSQEFTRVSIWRTILQNLTSKERKEEILKMEETDLHKELFQLLGTSKSLIVLDDIWKEEDWDLINPIFPSEKDCKVLLTSRNDSVAVRSKTTYNLKPECLTPEDSWEIFQRRALPRNDASELEIDEEMKKMGKEMVEHCGGLPLAVKVLGGMLAKKCTVSYWERVSKNIGSHLVGRRTDANDDKNRLVNYVLSLSFEELPSYLKHCFLYLAHFPEDYKIKVKNLSYSWAGDGIFEPRHFDGESILDIGDRYIEELVTRNMVISERDVTSLRTCHLHDMMREICLFKSKEENFLQIASNRPSTTNSQPPFTSRRFVSHHPFTSDVERDINNPKLRSLRVVVPNTRQRWKLSGSIFKRLELLRVLDLYRAELKEWKLPSDIGKLIHLRYLSLKGAIVYHLPASLGNLILLIYLHLDGVSVFVPNVLMGMTELRYLALPKYMKGKKKLELSNLVNLETLKNFSTKNCSIEDLRGMVMLRTLTMKLTNETSIKTLSALIGGLKHLEHLEILDYRSKRNLEEGIVWDFSNLKRLKLSMYMPYLLKEQQFSSHLTTLILSQCGFEDDPLPILEKLLQLKEVTLFSKSFIGRRMVCSGGGFPQLHKLKLVGLEEWEEWKVEEGSMPLLHTLAIIDCKKLKELPDGLRFITSLKVLYILGAPLEFKEKLSEGGEDFYKVQHILVLKIKLD